MQLVTAQTNFEALVTPTIPWDFDANPLSDALEIAKAMTEEMYKHDGLGISANQLGLPWSIFVMRGDPVAVFNPLIAQPGEEIVSLEEACLSFPGLTVKVKRPKVIRCRFAGPDGKVNSHTFTGMTARIFQHELDHLKGKVFFDGVSRFHLERAIRQAKNKGHDYSQLGLMKYVKKEKQTN